MSPSPNAGAATPRTAPAPTRRPVAPRRVSGPARRPAPLPPPTIAPSLARVVDHPLLDRLIRGRTWIGIVAFALIGIVGMQVALLELNAGIGSSVQRASTLARANALLAADVSSARADELRQAGVAHQGMVYAPPGDVRYLTAARGDAGQAAASMVAPRVAAAAAGPARSGALGAAAGGPSSQPPAPGAPGGAGSSQAAGDTSAAASGQPSATGGRASSPAGSVAATLSESTGSSPGSQPPGAAASGAGG